MINIEQRILPAAERRGLGGRPVLVQHQHRPGPLRRDLSAQYLQLLATTTPVPAWAASNDPAGHSERRLRRRWSSAPTRPSTGHGSPGHGDALIATREPSPWDRYRRRTATAVLRGAGDDARRPRRTGDVTSTDKMRCIECEEIELARVRDGAAQAQILDIPHAALAGELRGRAPVRADPPAAAAVRRCRSGGGLRRQAARLRTGSGSRSPRPPRTHRRTSAWSCSTWRAAMTAST